MKVSTLIERRVDAFYKQYLPELEEARYPYVLFIRGEVMEAFSELAQSFRDAGRHVELTSQHFVVEFIRELRIEIVVGESKRSDDAAHFVPTYLVRVWSENSQVRCSRFIFEELQAVCTFIRQFVAWFDDEFVQKVIDLKLSNQKARQMEELGKSEMDAFLCSILKGYEYYVIHRDILARVIVRVGPSKKPDERNRQVTFTITYKRALEQLEEMRNWIKTIEKMLAKVPKNITIEQVNKYYPWKRGR